MIGCATEIKRPVHHSHTKKKIVYDHDDAAMKALIKALRE
jgi:hypothetical protein